MKHLRGNRSYRRTLAGSFFAGFAVIAFTAVSASAQAQPAPQGLQAPQPDRAEMEKVMQDYQRVTEELNEIQNAALESNPELEAKRDEFQTLLEDKMGERGYDAEAGEKKLKDLHETLTSGDLEPEEQQKLVSEFQTAQSEMTQAHQGAMNDPEVQKARDELQHEVIAAMKEESDETSELLSELEAIQSQMQQMQSGLQQGGPPPAGPR